ncbi:hypothetical protein [Nocardioides sp.]|uniref:hypothetical protein n=1 Tax=Nocardioides sp. TaxID=35761 RepID=UPI000C927552|nr:hypothetical protein [Nocardioides sp.]MAS56302.1 hypothetical protein [Pimelobacter sp.]MDE0778114.1 hypothetical protein [Nocardioides sp.]
MDEDQRDQPPEQPQDQDGRGGQVSEVGGMDPADADTPISDDQSVAGSPSDESGEVDEGPQGPNARTGSDRA